MGLTVSVTTGEKISELGNKSMQIIQTKKTEKMDKASVIYGYKVSQHICHWNPRRK